MKNILITTDFSKNAYDALFYTTRLFKKQSCQFYILNTFDVNTPILTSRLDTGKGKALYQKLSADSECKLEEVLHKIHRDTEDLNHNFETISLSKPLIESIEKTVVSKKIDLVVMGTKGATGAKEIFMGSNTVKVIDSLDSCPVLIVPESVDIYPIYHIAFATEFTHKYKEDSLNTLKSFCELDEAILKMIYVSDTEVMSDSQKKNRNELEQFLDTNTIKNSTIHVTKTKSLEHHIKRVVENLEFDLLAMIKYRHGFMKKITREAVIKKMGHHTTKPFLVIPDELINVIF